VGSPKETVAEGLWNEQGGWGAGLVSRRMAPGSTDGQIAIAGCRKPSNREESRLVNVVRYPVSNAVSCSVLLFRISEQTYKDRHVAGSRESFEIHAEVGVAAGGVRFCRAKTAPQTEFLLSGVHARRAEGWRSNPVLVVVLDPSTQAQVNTVRQDSNLILHNELNSWGTATLRSSRDS